MDWKTAIADLITERYNYPFVWGTTDCAGFSADVILLVTGIDILAEYRGRYKTAIGAARIMKRVGGNGLEEFAEVLANRYGFVSIELSLIQNSDLCVIDTPIGDAMAVAWNGKAISQGEYNLILYPRSTIKRAWRYDKTGA